MGIRPDRRARGMLQISGGGSEWGVAESGRGGLNVTPTWGNAGEGNIQKWRYFGGGGLPEAPLGTLLEREADFGCFFGAF